MSRLINADSYLKNFCNRFCSVKECTSTQKKSCCIAISLEAEPTAFDVDKVVERLEIKLSDTVYEKATQESNESYLDGLSAGYCLSIGIVKEEGLK